MNEPEPLPPLFATALMDAMMGPIGAEPITSSELAHRVWGTVKDTRGYDVARNRDRIGQYLRGKSYPTPENLQGIAKALGVPEAELAAARRPLQRRQISREPAPEPPMTLIGRNTVTFGFAR
jgi:hypothetical protein